MKQINIHVHNFYIDWDADNRKDVEKAKLRYQQARREIREIVHADSGLPVTVFNPNDTGYEVRRKAIKDSEFYLRAYDETGDQLVVWDSEDDCEIQDAFKLYQKCIDKGWRAYARGDNGKNTKRIFSFDPKLEEIYFDEKKTIKEKLSDFVKTFREVHVTPRTRPGRR